MKISLLLLAVSLWFAAPLCADDHARGLKLLAEGKFAEAAAAFRAAATAEPTDPRVHYNLALALWRAGDAGAAEIAAEQAATLSDGKLVPLRDGILGNLKMGEAQATLAGEQPDLQAALGLAQKARDHFLHGAAEVGAPAELTRNLERALQLIAEIEKKIEEQKQEEQKDDEQKKDDDKKDEGKDGEKKPGDDKSDDKKPEDKKDDEKKPDEKKDDQQKSDDQKQPGKPEDKPPEPKPEEQPKPEQDPKAEQGAPEAKPGEDKEQKPEPKPGTEEPEPQAGEQKDAQATPPNEQRELSQEETKRLLDVLQRLQAQQVELEKARAAARPKVKKDW